MDFDSSSEIDETEEKDIKSHDHGNARALMAGKTLAELVADAGGNRKKAQAAVLAKLNGEGGVGGSGEGKSRVRDSYQSCFTPAHVRA